jgi:hypothetical protein
MSNDQTVLFVHRFRPITFGCYTNAAFYVTEFDQTAKYVEGIARHTYANGRTVDVEHGWAQDSQGRIVEVTWLRADYLSTVYIPKRIKTLSQLMRMKTWQRAYAEMKETE